MAKTKTPAEILAAQEPYSLLKDGRYFGLNEAAATPYVVQEHTGDVAVGELFSVVVGLTRSDAGKAGYESFRPLPAGAIDWVRDATNTALIEEVSHGTYNALDTDRVKFVFKAKAAGTVSLQFAYNAVGKSATGALEVKETKTTAITQVITPVSATPVAGKQATLLVAVQLDKAKYQPGENVSVSYLFNNEDADLDKIYFVATKGLTHTGTPAKSGCRVNTTFTVGADEEIGTVQGITVYYDKQMAKVGKLTVYDPAYVAPAYGYDLAEISPLVAASQAHAHALEPEAPAVAGGPAVAALDAGDATPAAVAAEPAAEEPAAATSKSKSKSKAVAE